jgi:hypothetical protein
MDSSRVNSDDIPPIFSKLSLIGALYATKHTNGINNDGKATRKGQIGHVSADSIAGDTETYSHENGLFDGFVRSTPATKLNRLSQS